MAQRLDRGARIAAVSLDWPPHRQLQQIVYGTDQTPFALDLFQTSQQKLSEAACLLDLPKDRFGQRLAQPVATAPPGTRELGAHRCHARGRIRTASAYCSGLAVALPPGGDVGIDVVTGQDGEVTFRAIPRVSGELLISTRAGSIFVPTCTLPDKRSAAVGFGAGLMEATSNEGRDWHQTAMPAAAVRSSVATRTMPTV